MSTGGLLQGRQAASAQSESSKLARRDHRIPLPEELAGQGQAYCPRFQRKDRSLISSPQPAAPVFLHGLPRAGIPVHRHLSSAPRPLSTKTSKTNAFSIPYVAFRPLFSVLRKNGM